MQRICTSLAENGFAVTLVGRRLPSSAPLPERAYKQKRIYCWFKKGKWFYAEYNIRLFFFLLFSRMDAVCAIDLDTILPCLKISRWKKVPRVYDAHELFTELKEVITRPAIQRKWLHIEQKAVPQFKYGYTVSDGIAEVFKERYQVEYATIRNMPLLKPLEMAKTSTESFIVYQGAINEARGFEYLIPAMQEVNCKLIICGDGNFMPQLKELIQKYNLENKVALKGMLPSGELFAIAAQATVGMALAEKQGLNQWLALPNKFFDYMHAALPQVTMNFPEYQKVNSQYEIALLIDDLNPGTIAAAINKLLKDDALRNKLRTNCLKAREIYNWQQEEKRLLAFYNNLFEI